MGLLKRNAADRLDFDIFFNHPFIRPTVSPVPSARSRTSPVKVPSSEKQTTPTTTATGTVQSSTASNQSTPRNPTLPLTSVDVINPAPIESPLSQAPSGGITTVVAGRKTSPKTSNPLNTIPRGQQTGLSQSPGSNKHLPPTG